MLFLSQNKWSLVLLFGIYLESLKAEVLSNLEDSFKQRRVKRIETFR